MDNRRRNTYFKTDTISAYVAQYGVTLQTCLASVRNIDRALEVVGHASRTFVCGNGGSAAIAEHWACDHTRPVIPVCSNSALLTALANDYGYEDTMWRAIDRQGFLWRDVVIAISSSGNSPNIVKAAEYALDRGAPVIGLTGFDGGALKKLATVSLHVPFANYGIVEDCHSALMHCLAQYEYAQTLTSGAV